MSNAAWLFIGGPFMMQQTNGWPAWALLGFAALLMAGSVVLMINNWPDKK